MRILNYIAAGIVLLTGITSCMENEDKLVDEPDMGTMVLKVETKVPQASKAISYEDTRDFPVIIQGIEGSPVSSVIKEFKSVKDLPDTPIYLQIGQYTVTSHSPYPLLKHMDKAYFAGDSKIDIIKDVTTSTKVTCKMKNSKIELTYDEKFKESFTEWDITIDDGTSSVLNYSEKDLDPAPIYFYFGEEGAAALTVNIVATTKDGDVIRDRRTLTKSQANESYDDDNSNFVGGDGLIIDMEVLDKEHDKPNGDLVIDMHVDIVFNEHSDDVNIDITDKLPDVPDNPVNPDQGGGDEGGGNVPQESTASIELPDDFVLDPTSDQKVEAILRTPDGLRSAIVKITTDNDTFHTTLSTVAFPNSGDLLKGSNMIGNSELQKLLQDLGGGEYSAPKIGDKVYVFPLHVFFNILKGFSGKHTFELTIEDNKGGTATDALTITINPQ